MTKLTKVKFDDRAHFCRGSGMPLPPGFEVEPMEARVENSMKFAEDVFYSYGRVLNHIHG